mgnify:CR=1 FL=1|tara:strand:+ start:2054 stop:2347 length:294 start_codon:yes stop_codon:yes gene_type:complete
MKKIVEVITEPLSVEAEFEVEQEIRRILALEDINELRALSALLMKQNACQSHVILHSLTKITQLERRIKTLQARVTTLMKAKFPLFQPLKSVLGRNS